MMVKSTALPSFSTIDINQFTPQFKQLLTDSERHVNQLLQTERHYTWENLMLPMEELEDVLDNTFAPVRHLHGVRDNPQLRDAYEQCLAAITDYATSMGQNTQLYQAVKSIADSPDFTHLSPVQQHIINHQLRDFHLAGVDLPTADKQRFKQIKARLSELTTAFEQHVLDATQAWQHHVTDERQLAGLPAHALAKARELAEQQQLPGWVLTLDFPCYHAVICYADDAALRETIYHAYVTRASDQGPQAGQFDNSELMVEIVRLRHELAQLAGFPSFAHYSLAPKMADSPQQVLDFLHDLVARARPQAKEDFTELQRFASQKLQIDQLQPWDINYVSEKLRQQAYAISQEDLRPYFPENQVLQGIFDIVHRLYGIAFSERDDIDTWHKDVRFFDLIDEQQRVCGHLYVDLYARNHKRGGAWMDECISRRRTAGGQLQLPAAFLTCNLAPPSASMPALFSHDEVVTIFHELGHCLHHLLTQIDYADASGIRGVPWDAVELPSQFFERWAWQPEALALISQHYQTGETLPADLIERLLRSRHFQSAMQLVRQLEFALFDFNLHHAAPPTSAADITTLLQNIRDQVSVVPVPDYHRFQHGFSHIFAGGYAAGYYSYLWAEVLACDAFAKFLEQGIFDAATGRQFLNSILSQGGSQEAMDLFVAFRGREPTIDAFLLDNGIGG
jgi:oligopeptidase A